MVKRIIYIVFWVIILLYCCETTKGQPLVLGTDAANYSTYVTYNLTVLGKLRQYKLQALTTTTSGQAKWEFAIGTAASPNYTTNWRPYLGPFTLFAFDSIIYPNSSPIVGAMYNSGSGGSSGFLPALTSGNYYTVNVSDSTGNNYVAVWETTFNPAVISVVVQNPTIVCDGGDSVTVNVTSNQALNVTENAYLRYSLTNVFTTSTLVPLTFSGTNGSAKIPVPALSSTIYFYVFTSKYSAAKLAPGGLVNERYCDLSSLSLNNNSNSNYNFTVVTGAIPSTNFTSSNYCVGTPTVFTNSSTISSGSIDSLLWTFGNGITSTSMISPLANTYSSTGNYTVTLRALSNLGCQKTSTQAITIHPYPSENSINAN
ncbi:MAG: PKD domain-containing protein [Bacteroidia bacterium]